MIHVFVGTKAQFIKMAPLMQELERREIPYNFIDAGQHAALVQELIKQFDLRQPDICLREERTNITTLGQAALWTASHLCQLALRQRKVCSRIFGRKGSICLIHGDTLTTLLSLLYAKRCGIKVAHIEAGLRSYRLLNPFPEEIVRLIAMRFSDLLFAPSEWAHKNLCQMGYRTKSINVGANTGLDAVRYAIETMGERSRPARPYAMVTIHRIETIYSRSRMEMIAAFIERMSQKIKVLLILHEPTRRQFLKFGLLSRIKRLKNVQVRPLLPYLEFINLLAGSAYVVTDGGSVQEECYYLDKPCMVMRSKTERLEGLGENAFVTEFDENKIEHFLEYFPAFGRRFSNENIHPSGIIIDHLLRISSNNA